MKVQDIIIALNAIEKRLDNLALNADVTSEQYSNLIDLKQKILNAEAYDTKYLESLIKKLK
jgi:hypothetical protein